MPGYGLLRKRTVDRLKNLVRTSSMSSNLNRLSYAEQEICSEVLPITYENVCVLKSIDLDPTGFT